MRQYTICKRCVMDTSDPEIAFNSEWYCNHCSNLLADYKLYYADPKKNKDALSAMMNLVKKEGHGKKYDCIIGLSGGVDSSYLAYCLVKDYGLRPLAVHVDNGWNSEEAVSNINNLTSKLNIDLVTHVIDWEEFKELQKAFLKASVVDLELLSDHAISVVTSKIAKKHEIKYFLIGANYQTESILPPTWFYSDKQDSANIKDIYSKYGRGKKLKTYPLLNFLEYAFFNLKYGKWLMPLSLMTYDKNTAKQILVREMDWKDYGGKHHESFITKFYQTYILPVKFNVDKRRAHFSNLIAIGQLSREEALNLLKKEVYNSQNIQNDIEYFCKKLEISREEFDSIMREPRKEHSEFKTYKHRKKKLWAMIHKLRPSKKRQAKQQ